MGLELKPVESAEVITLVDNYVDQVARGSENVVRTPLLKGPVGGEINPILAEHGFSVLVRLRADGQTYSILMDAGSSGTALLNNAEAVGVDLDEVQAMVISHGHLDHVGGLKKAAQAFRHEVPVVVHPEAFLDRYIVWSPEQKVEFPKFRAEDYTDSNLIFQITTEPTLLADGHLVSTGQIPRKTEFEKGFPVQYAMKDGELTPDPEVKDDQSLVFVIKGKGLVVISGCGHSGIINTLNYAMEMTGESELYAVMGGFHLQWPLPEEIVNATIKEIEKKAPKIVIPTHCTGWDSCQRLAQAMPDAFILNTTGSVIKL